jgi:hypothetical protein
MIGPSDISADDSGKTFFISQNPPSRLRISFFINRLDKFGQSRRQPNFAAV